MLALGNCQWEAAILEREEACKGCPTFIQAFFLGKTSGCGSFM